MIAEQERFLQVCTQFAGMEREKSGIGTLGEKTLHAVLKKYLEPCVENQEIKVDRYFADIKNRQGITEIQTRNFNALRAKLEAFLPLCPVSIVYPIASTKWLVWLDNETGECSKRRKSPKKGKAWDAFFELYKIKPFLLREGISLRLMFIDLVEYRNLDGWSDNKKRGSSRYERIPIGLVDELLINTPKDYLKLMPPGLPQVFTTKDFKKVSGLSLNGAQTALNVLFHVGAVSKAGKSGRLTAYTVNSLD